MTDHSTTDFVIPAITLGYTVSDDKQGKFIFFTDNIEVIYRSNTWIGRDKVRPFRPVREYENLQEALESEI